MQNIIRITLALALLPLTASPSRASANLSTHIVVSELQIGTAESASHEFVELYNPAASEISLQGWTIEYKAATSANLETSWIKKATMQGSIPSHGFYLVASKTYLSLADAEWSPTLASSGGTIRIKDAEGLVIDLVGYGGANTFEGSSASLPPAGGSIERLPGPLQPLGGNGEDTENNASDFMVRAAAEPQSSIALRETFSELPLEETEESFEQSPVVTQYPKIVINELLVDPITPLNDSEDEFIELYNPSSESIDLTDFVLRCGTNFRDYYKLSDEVIAPGGYLVLYSGETKLGLTNAGGSVRLLDPNGTIIDQTSAYEDAPPGQTWAFFEEGWEWTLQHTPGHENKLEALPLASPASTVKPKATSKKTAVKAAAKPKKAAAPKVAKPKKPKKAKVVKTQFAAVPVATSSNLQPSTWLIISLAILTIGYACYEFRYDLYNLYYKLRRHDPNRQDNREAVGRRRRD